MHSKISPISNCDAIIDSWIKALDEYSFSQLIAIPSSNSWSVGQVYVHIIQAANFFNKQILACVSNNDHMDGKPYPEARSMFNNNDLPDILLEGPPSNATTPQPTSKEQLTTGLKNIKEELRKAELLISQTSFKGKAKHFGLGYFTASEWMQFAEMHFRHHLRQKKRLDEFLAANNVS